MCKAHKHVNRLNLICHLENAHLNHNEIPFKSIRWAKTSKSNKTKAGERSRDSSATHENAHGNSLAADTVPTPGNPTETFASMNNAVICNSKKQDRTQISIKSRMNNILMEH